mgnify:CR=1 FL=1
MKRAKEWELEPKNQDMLTEEDEESEDDGEESEDDDADDEHAVLVVDSKQLFDERARADHLGDQIEDGDDERADGGGELDALGQLVAQVVRVGDPIRLHVRVEDLLGDALQLVDGVADGADRAGAEAGGLGGIDEIRHHDAGVHCRIHEVVEMFVDERLAAPFADLADAPVVAAKHQEHRRVVNPLHVRNGVGNGFDFGAVGDVDDVGLLQIGFRRRGKRASEQQTEQRGLNRLAGPLAMGAVLDHAPQFIGAGHVRRRGGGFAKAGLGDCLTFTQTLGVTNNSNNSLEGASREAKKGKSIFVLIIKPRIIKNCKKFIYNFTMNIYVGP